MVASTPPYRMTAHLMAALSLGPLRRGRKSDLLDVAHGAQALGGVTRARIRVVALPSTGPSQRAT